MNRDKILIGTPVYTKSSVYLECLFATWATFPINKVDFLIVVNGALNLSLIQMLRKLKDRYGIFSLKILIQATGHFDIWGALTKAQNTIIQYCIENSYSHLLFHEASRLATVETLSALIEYDKPVIGCLYKDTYNPGYYCVYDFDSARNIHCYDNYVNINLIKEPTLVFGVGFGFTLIKVSVLEQTHLRSAKFASDTYFFMDLHHRKIPVYVAPHFVENLKITHSPQKNIEWELNRLSKNQVKSF